MSTKVKCLSSMIIFTVIFSFSTEIVKGSTLNDPILGWNLNLPDNWKQESQEDKGTSLFGHPGRSWMFMKDPMNYVAYQVVNYDLRDPARLEQYKKENFDAISASMQHTAQQAGAKSYSNREDIQVGGHIFHSIIWALQAPGREEFKNMTLVGSLADKAVTIGISCTGSDCDTAFNAIDRTYFAILPVTNQNMARPPAPPSNNLPIWDFSIPVGWTRVAVSSPEDVLAIEKGEDDSLTYALIEDEDQELASLTIHDIKGEIFKEMLVQFQQIAQENGLLLSTEEEVTMLGSAPFQTLSLGLQNPDNQEQVMIAAQLIAIINKRLAMISITCTTEQNCNEIQHAVEQSSFR